MDRHRDRTIEKTERQHGIMKARLEDFERNGPDRVVIRLQCIDRDCPGNEVMDDEIDNTQESILGYRKECIYCGRLRTWIVYVRDQDVDTIFSKTDIGVNTELE